MRVPGTWASTQTPAPQGVASHIPGSGLGSTWRLSPQGNKLSLGPISQPLPHQRLYCGLRKLGHIPCTKHEQIPTRSPRHSARQELCSEAAGQTRNGSGPVSGSRASDCHLQVSGCPHLQIDLIERVLQSVRVVFLVVLVIILLCQPTGREWSGRSPGQVPQLRGGWRRLGRSLRAHQSPQHCLWGTEEGLATVSSSQTAHRIYLWQECQTRAGQLSPPPPPPRPPPGPPTCHWSHLVGEKQLQPHTHSPCPPTLTGRTGALSLCGLQSAEGGTGGGAPCKSAEWVFWWGDTFWRKTTAGQANAAGLLAAPIPPWGFRAD